MRLKENEINEFMKQIQIVLQTEQVHEMKNYIQHGNTSTFTHCLIVAYYSYLLSKHLPYRHDLDFTSLIRGAMLHDFYLYDWHVPDRSHKLHGYVHPVFALANARKYFSLNKTEEDIIEKHMWPLTLRKAPKSKEALLVCFVDKFCSTRETLYIPLLPKEYKQIYRMINRLNPNAGSHQIPT